MNFGDSMRKQQEVLSFSNSKHQFTTSHNPRPQSTLSFQKSNILPCNIYNQRHSAITFQPDLLPIYERNESIKSSLQNSFYLGSYQQREDPVNVLDISEELLLSSKECSSRKQFGRESLCPSHQKHQDIICMVDRCKICSHCALFGEHKDHNFKSQAQFLEELNTQASKLNNLQETHKTFLNCSQLQEGWQKLRRQCQVKEKQLLQELSIEFTKLLQKIESTKRQIQSNIREQSQSVQSIIQQQNQLCKKDGENNKAFLQWIKQGRRILSGMKENFDSSLFEQSYNEYDTFAWLQGDYIVGQEKDKVQRMWQGIKRGIDEMRLNLNQQALQNLSSSLFLASQIQFASQIDTSMTSLDDLHKHLGIVRTESNQKFDNQFLDFREFKFRNSECLQAINEPGRTSVGHFDKAQRMSAKCFSKKGAVSSSKKENKPMSSSHFSNITFLQRQKSDSKLETSLCPMRTKMKVINSPKIPRSKPDPMRIIVEYQRNQNATCLNLSECNLSEDSLVYFLERAGKARPPIQVNLEKNNLSSGGFTKLLPYFVCCARINLSYCGLGQGCLESLLRTKALKRLQECNLTGNDINTKKNRMKLEELKRGGIRIICN